MKKKPGCTYNGRTYLSGETFPSEDGCNKCACSDSGSVICTLRLCIDPCSLPPDTGNCRASIGAYYYDRSTDACRRFTYGGCGGNANKFSTARDCLLSCQPESECLLPKDRGPCDGAEQAFFFNGTSGRCDDFTYGGCPGNENRFDSLNECFRECSPDGELDRCSTVRCPSLECPDDHELQRDDQHCCPFCIPLQGRCEADEYRCASGECIANDHLCDRITDCPDNADEEACGDVCEFRCGDKTCLPNSRVCDQIVDCRDGADIRNCTRRFQNAYYLTSEDIPVQCPDTGDVLGVCIQECVANDGCDDGKICCSNGCGRACTKGTQVNPLCSSIRGQRDADRLLGQFQPTCEEDGSFSGVQCHEGYCWCVDVTTGQPVADGVRSERPECLGCRVRNGDGIIRVGENYRTDDGCNTCTCMGPDNVACTLLACDEAPCRFQDKMIPANSSFTDDCNTCRCFAGSLTCQRKQCNTAVTGRLRRLVRAILRFGGNFTAIRDRIDDFKREIIRSFLNKYSSTVGFNQDQIQDIEVYEGSVIVVIGLSDSNSSTDGANITVLLSQVQHDYESGTLVIRYNNEVLFPSGEFAVEESSSDSMASGLLLWQIIVIAVGSIVFLILIIIILAAVITIWKKRSGRYNFPSGNSKPIADDSGYGVPLKSCEKDSEVKEPLA